MKVGQHIAVFISELGHIFVGKTEWLKTNDSRCKTMTAGCIFCQNFDEIE